MDKQEYSDTRYGGGDASNPQEGVNTVGNRGADGTGCSRAFGGRSLDDEGEPRGHGNYFGGARGILAFGHESHTSSSNARMATKLSSTSEYR
jgi:hypothetical protein